MQCNEISRKEKKPEPPPPPPPPPPREPIDLQLGRRLQRGVDFVTKATGNMSLVIAPGATGADVDSVMGTH